MANNAAYDLSVYENAARQQREQNQNNRRPAPKPQPAKQFSVVKFMLTAFLAAFLLCVILNGNAQQNAEFMAQSEINSQIAQLTEENARLQAQLETKTSLKNVEDYAENVLGLQKLDTAQMEYVELESTNVIRVVEKEDKGIFVSLKNWFFDTMEYIGL